jgi:hypothetical protein
MNLQNWAYLVGLFVGVIVILSVVFVFVKSQTLNSGGIMLTLVGMILIGLSIWSNIKLEGEGFTIELNKIKSDVNRVATASTAVNEEVIRIAKDVNSNNQQVAELSKVISENNPVLREQILKVTRQTPALVNPKTFIKLDSANSEFLKLSKSNPVHP